MSSEGSEESGLEWADNLSMEVPELPMPGPEPRPWTIDFDADPALCTRMVQSLGGWRNILEHMLPTEQIVLQQLDKWQYNVAVSRVQHTFSGDPPPVIEEPEYIDMGDLFGGDEDFY